LAYVNYSPENAWRPESRCAVVFWLIGRFFDAVFAIDVAVNFTTGFYHEHTRAYITSLSDVVPKYLGSWFLVDIAALVPSELFFRHGRATRLIKLLKLKHLAGSVRVDLRSSRIDAHVVELVQHVYLACAVIHVVCCMWSLDLLYQEQAGVERPFHERDVRDAYELGFDANGEPTNWVSANGVLGGRFEYYVAALQLLFQGEMRCANLTERCMLVVSMAMLYGLLIFILTEVMVLLGEINSMRGRYRALVRDMNSMMRDHGFPQVLRNRMRAYLRFRQTGSAGGLVNVPAERVVLNMLSPQLRVEAVLAMNKANVEAVPLFRQCAIPSDAIVILSVNAVVQVYAGHEFIFRTGEPADFMNCVNKGIVMAKGQMLCKGDTFGREAALGTRCAYTGSAFTLTNTTIVHLSSHSFFEMFKKFPDAELRVRKVLSQRMARDALMAYARYMRAIDAGRGEQFRKNIFNLGFSRTMLARMFLTRSNSIVEFLQMEKLVVQMQRAWRQRMARRRRHEEKLRARVRVGAFPNLIPKFDALYGVQSTHVLPLQNVHQSTRLFGPITLTVYSYKSRED
jgi:CRP-like cAMP-binding protein